MVKHCLWLAVLSLNNLLHTGTVHKILKPLGSLILSKVVLMASRAQQLHVFFFPLMAPGHILPMVDMAKLFAAQDVKVTLLSIPSSMPLLSRMIEKDSISRQPINLVCLQLPPGGLKLPGGHESLTSLATLGLSTEFFEALESLRQPLDQILKEHRPACIVSDMFLPWTVEVAGALGIPRLVFHGMGFFPLCVLDSLGQHESADDLPEGSNGKILVPGLPDRIEMKRSQLHDSVIARNKFSKFMDLVVESELQSFGVVVNSFYELEPPYADHFRTVMRRKAWHIGPASVINNNVNDLASRGAPASSESIIRGRTLIAWLDQKPPSSVLYVCFGSLSQLANAQLQEISQALKASNCPFIWIMRDINPDQRKERMIREEGKGLVVRGWAPQMLILGHRAIGGFMMHCGWNSLMESLSAGVPLITWPMFAEQFYTERLVVDVLHAGVPVGAEEWGVREEDKAVLGAEKIRRAVARVMDGGEEAECLHHRARELGNMAMTAVAAGGSSHTDLVHLISELRNIQSAGLRV